MSRLIKGSTMTYERYKELQHGDNPTLTDEEFAQGWHWCMDWDLMLVHPTMEEAQHCYCFKEMNGKEESS